jgi:hypothetical protein
MNSATAMSPTLPATLDGWALKTACTAQVVSAGLGAKEGGP